MSKQDSSSDDDNKTETVAADADPEQSGDSAREKKAQSDSTDTAVEADPDAVKNDEAASAAESESAAADETAAETEAEAEQTAVEPAEGDAGKSPPPAKPRRPWFALFNFLLIIALAAVAAYYWQQRQQLDAAYQSDIEELRRQLADKASIGGLQSSLQSSLKSGLSPLERELGELGSKVEDLGLGQQSLRESSEMLYELYGRDKNDWQLAEVEYLMRVAQHKLILQDDFEGAAITLQAASDRIGLTGDPGLLPVRVMISEEIADLKTRKRPDLVGMTLILAQLGRQVRALQPGFGLRVDEVREAPPKLNNISADDWLARFNVFINSLITIRKESTEPTEIEANIIDVSEALEDNLKLARWAVLERNASQYKLLLERSLRLFREFYDLDNAANHDFMTQLQDLQKMEIKPEKPDITGSLRELQRILSQRENAPPVNAPAGEPDNG